MQIDPLSLTKSDVDTRILERGCNELRFYDGQTHEGLFMLPKYVREILDQENRIILDESPLVVF